MDDINSQLHDIEVGCSWCKVSSIGQHKLTRPTNISIRRSCCREQITPPSTGMIFERKYEIKRWNKNMKWKDEKNILSTRIWTLENVVFATHKAQDTFWAQTQTIFGVSNWNLFSKHPSSFVIARTSASTLPSKYDTLCWQYSNDFLL